jgi:hypothetical protein
MEILAEWEADNHTPPMTLAVRVFLRLDPWNADSHAAKIRSAC